MAKERLSKLQKWILEYSSDKPMISRRELLFGYFKEATSAAEAALSRSLWQLLEREYIAGLSPMKLTNMAIIYGMQRKSVEDFEKDYGHLKLSEKIPSPSLKGFSKIKVVMMTDKGKEKVSSLKFPLPGIVFCA